MPVKHESALPPEYLMFASRSSVTRRDFFRGAASAMVSASVARSLLASSYKAMVNVAAVDRARILRAANGYLNAEPITLTSSHSPRSGGGLHDYFSEGAYWWPDAARPGGAYVRQDGFVNPETFNRHRDALIRLSLIVPALTAAWKLTGQRRYADQAAAHLRAWFVDPLSRMNPNLEYAQAIYSVTPGRGCGIIETTHLVEPARAAGFLLDGGVFSLQDHVTLRGWFSDYLRWLTSSQNGAEARDAKDHHGSCWVMQVAEFARFTGDSSLQAYCRERFREVLVPNQIATNGSLPLELTGNRPYGSSLFGLDVLSGIAQILETPEDDLFAFQMPDGRGLRAAVAYMEPFLADKRFWPYPYDMEGFDDLPVRQPSLLFAGLAYNEPQYIALWKTLNPDPTAPAIIRIFPIRQPLLWV